MRITKCLIGVIGFALYGALPGFTTYGQPSVEVDVNVQPPAVEIRADSDFYAPLTPYGEWEVVGSYGRCWRPGHVARDWRPYCNGNWERTEAGWYWVSDEPWAWATYHYGRWDFTDRYGWYWVPQTQWAPAWVSWHRGGGYIGWAPLYPAEVRVISPRAYVFVEERHFVEPVRSTTVIVNNTTIINRTVVSQAPTSAVIEQVSGRKVQMAAVRDLRHREEAREVSKQKAAASATGRTSATAVRSEAAPRENKPVVALPPPANNAAATRPEAARSAPRNNEAQSEKRPPGPVSVESRPDARAEGNHPPPVVKESTRKTPNPHPEKRPAPAQTQSERKEQPPAPPAPNPGLLPNSR